MMCWGGTSATRKLTAGEPVNDPKPLRGDLDQYELIGSQPFAIGRTSACFRALNSQQTIVCIKQFSQQPIASGDCDSKLDIFAYPRHSKLVD